MLVVALPLCLAGLLYAMASFTTAERDAYAACYVAFHTLFELMRVVCEAEGARDAVRAAARRAPSPFSHRATHATLRSRPQVPQAVSSVETEERGARCVYVHVHV